jgi:proton-dependent oligopeptide transporter, POT family
MTQPPTGVPVQSDRGWFGHPRGLSTLFFTEMWERFSYYGMRAFLILYMTKALGFTDADAGVSYGNYVSAVWLTPILGGLIADRWLGQYRSVLYGGILIALGHFALAFRALPFFYAGLTLIVLGTGLLKPNISALVGSLYEAGDERRDAGFSIFYMGINLGAFIGPFIAGGLAEKVDWHLGFACAGIGMLFGLAQYVLGRSRLQPGIDRLARTKAAQAPSSAPGGAAAGKLTRDDWRRIAAVLVLFLFASLFWGAYEQAGSTLSLFADRYVNLELLGIKLYASWFASIQAGFVILLSPFFAWLWVRLGARQPSSPAKFALALVFVGLAFILLIPAGSMAQQGIKVSPMWLVWAYLIQELGELCLSPVGLSLVTKVAPARLVSVLMGMFFLSNALGNWLAGWSTRFVSTAPLTTLFGVIAAITIGAGLILFLLLRPIRNLMGGVR